jgi:hypothetical protein
VISVEVISLGLRVPVFLKIATGPLFSESLGVFEVSADLKLSVFEVAPLVGGSTFLYLVVADGNATVLGVVGQLIAEVLAVVVAADSEGHQRQSKEQPRHRTS